MLNAYIMMDDGSTIAQDDSDLIRREAPPNTSVGKLAEPLTITYIDEITCNPPNFKQVTKALNKLRL